MIVVADSGPLHYLILLGEVALLHKCYGDVLIPPAVWSELSSPGAPPPVRDWVLAPASWLRVEHVDPQDVEAVSDELDLGERQAIALAQRVKADLLLMDDMAGRAEAHRRHLRVTGTLGVLLRTIRGLLRANHVVESRRRRFVIMYILMYIYLMSRKYSIAEARSRLPSIVDQAEAGVEVELTRRGQPVAVVVSRREFERLRGKWLHFGDAYRKFLEKYSLEDIGVEHNFSASTRDKTTGRKVSL